MSKSNAKSNGSIHGMATLLDDIHRMIKEIRNTMAFTWKAGLTVCQKIDSMLYERTALSGKSEVQHG